MGLTREDYEALEEKLIELHNRADDGDRDTANVLHHMLALWQSLMARRF